MRRDQSPCQVRSLPLLERDSVRVYSMPPARQLIDRRWDSNGESHVLGIWDQWLHDELTYTDGDVCPNGQARNTTVKLECEL